MAKYRRRPIEVDAVQWWKMGDHALVDQVPKDLRPRQPSTHGYMEGRRGGVVEPGDWIVTHADGIAWRIRRNQFERMFEPVD